MLRIVEIENQSAKSMFHEGKSPTDHDGDETYECTAAKPVAPTPDPNFDSTAAHPELASSDRARRISFRDNRARPSNVAPNTTGTSSPARKRSPPPLSTSRNRYSDDDEDDDTSSDDYDEPETYVQPDRNAAPTEQQVHNADPDEDEDDLDNDMDGLSLTRFESASAQPPRMVRSDSSSSSEDDEDPVTPPQLPADVDVRDIIGGVKDSEMMGLYESVRRCTCHGHGEDSDAGRKAEGVWDVPAEKAGGRKLAVVAIAA